jgi:hypothetical protein
MMNRVVKTIDGASVSLSSDVLAGLAAGLRGTLSFPGDARYEEARTIWNAMIDKRPAAIVHAAGASDVIHTVRLAAQHGCSSRSGAVGTISRETPCATAG